MADSKITALAALTTADPANDMFPVVDVSDTTMAASGTTKRISINNILACSPSATLASATITGAATVGTTLGVTGVSTFAAGTALLPALTTTGDTNTGIYYPAADTFAVTTGGTERYRVDSSGNVGIGVTPSATAGKLQVFGTGDQTDENATLMVGSSSTNGMRFYTGVNNTNEYCYIGSVKSGVGYRTLKLQPNGGNAIICLAITPPTLSVAGDMVFNLTSNTNLRISVRGTDGVTRTANLTLA